MFTNQKVLGLLLVLFILGTTTYLAISKFSKEVIDATTSPSPSPSPATLSFLFDQTPQSTPQVETKTPSGVKQGPQNQPASSELPLAKTKRLSQFPGILKPEVLQNKVAVIETAKGIIYIQIYPDVPQAASNFLLLASNGFYDGLTFHRVENGFVVQGGDPNGDGTGGPGYTFADESVNREYMKGTVAMANAGPNTNGSQFFILLADQPELPKKYTIFGAVIKGMDVVEKISVGDIMQKVTVQNLQ